MLSDEAGWGHLHGEGKQVFWSSNLYFFYKENWIWPMPRHHAEWSINMLMTRSLPVDFGVKQWSHSLMKPLHCLWAKSNNKTRGQFEFDVMRLFFHSSLDWEGEGSWKLDNFHGRRMCIVPKVFTIILWSLFRISLNFFQSNQLCVNHGIALKLNGLSVLQLLLGKFLKSSSSATSECFTG